MNIYTKKKRLTYYGFSLGYIESKYSRRTKKSVEMLKEHNVYHVKSYLAGKRLSWDSFHTLTEARKFYSSLKVS